MAITISVTGALSPRPCTSSLYAGTPRSMKLAMVLVTEASTTRAIPLMVAARFTVTLTLNSDQPLGKARAQVRWDAAAFQLQGGDPGGAVPGSSGAKVIGRSGGAQIDINAPSDDQMSSGDVMVLKFKAVQARPKTAIAGQVSVMSSSGLIVGSATPAPLSIEVGT